MKTNARKYISLLLALCMVMSLLPAAALAATTENNHGEHTGWTPLSRTISSSNSFYQDGNYYLDSDVSTYQGITINFDVTLCLNGHTLNMGQNTLTVSSGATLTICDCGSGGAIKGTVSYSNLYNMISVTGGTLNLESGTISGTTTGHGSLISVTDGGTLNVTGGTISLNHTGSVATNGVQAVKLSYSTGSFTGGEVSLTTAVDNNRATTVYQEGGSVTMGGSAEIVFEWTTGANPNATPGSGALGVTNSGQATINTGCTITALRTDGEMAGAVSIGTLNDATGTATITGGGINGALVVYGTAEISDGSFDFIQNLGTLTMTDGTVENENEYGILTNVTAGGATTLSNVTINAQTGVYVNTGLGPTISDGVTINATQYGVYGNATLVGDPVIEGGTADLYIHSMSGTIAYPSVDATAYTGGALTVQERKFPDAHQGGYIGCAIKVSQEKQSLFSLTNSDGNFVYQYDEANSALRLYNQNAHPICGASCSHEDASHSNPAWQQWSTPSGYTLTGGSYYLTGTVTLSQPITVTGDVNLCLNGKTIKRSDDSSSPFQVQEGGSLTICDCQTGGRLTGGIAATGGNIGIYGGTISGGAYAVDLGGNAKLTLAGSPALAGTTAALKLYTKSGTTLDNAAVDATDYTGGELTVQEDDVLGGADGFAIRGGENTFSLTNPSGGYRYAYEDGGYVIRPDHTHSYTYSGSGNIITESCTCDHSETATISVPDSSYTYTGSAITPAKVEYSTGWLGGDLTITYSDNTNVGIATASITKNDQTAQVTFTITAKAYGESSDITIGSIDDQTYTGSAIQPTPVIKDGDKKLNEGTDYDLTYRNNTNKGTGTVTITFKGNYSGTTEKTFNIVYAGLPNDKTLSDYVTIPQANDNGWYNQDITLTPKDGVSIGTTDAATDGVTIATEGEHTQTVFIKDSEGHIYETEVTYKLDKTDPAVSNVDKPAEDAVWTDENVTVSFDVSDETSGIQTVTVTDKDGKSVTVTPGSEGKYNFTATENGTYTVTVTDNAGNTTTQEIEIKNIDKTAPTLSISGGMKSAEELTLTVNASNTGGSDIQSVTVQKDGGEPANIEGNSYTITAPGTYTFTATTGAGVTSTVTKTVHSVTIGTDAQLVVDGGKVTKPADPEMDGYTFDCWMNGQSEWNFATGVTADLTLTAKWTLNAPTVTLTASDDNVIYGEKITLTAAATHAASVTYAYEWYKGGEKLDGKADSTLTIKNVNDSGSYTVKVTATDTDGLTAEKTSESVTVSVDKAYPVTTWPTASDITYGQSLSASTLSGGSAVPGSFAWKDGSKHPTSGNHSYTVAFTPDDTANYNSVEQSVTVQVNKATLTPSVASAADKTYDGNTSTTGTIKLEGAVLGENPTAGGVFTFEDAKADENKTVNVNVTLNGSWDENYVLSTETLTDTANITPKTVGLTWSGYENLVYDGEPVGVTAAATGLVSGDQCAVTVENGNQTNAGTYTAEAKSLSNGNYKLPADVEQSYTIAPLPVELSWSESSFTYDGSEKTVTATITNIVSGDACELTYRDNVKTEHGSYTAEVTALDNANYTLTNGTDLTHSWSIGKAVVSFSVSGNSHTYDGDPKTAEVTQDEGQTQIPAGGYEVKYGDAENQTEAGTYDISVTITNGNFCFEGGETSKVVGQLTITAADVPIPEADETAFIYNGAEQTYHIAESGLYAVSGNVQVDAGTYTVTVALKDKANYVWPDGTTVERTYTFTISPKTVTATWVGLEQVYGSVEPVYVILSGLAEGDEGLEAVISGVSTEAGEHPLNASLKNYDIINGTATLRIQQKPVTITVTDNAVTVGSEPAISAPGLAESDYEVVYKDKNGNEVTPSEPGTYEVWVEITNPNYRHPDGSSEKQVGSVVVSSGMPRTYEVSFAGSGAGGSTAGMSAAGGSAVILPECGFTKPGSVFTGWKYFNVVYKPGDSFTMPSSDVTFTAQWAQSQSVGGKVQDKGGAPVEGAAVSIWQGSNKLDEDVTGSNGAYSFPDLAPGSYNVSVSTGEKTVTTVVMVDENGRVTGGNIVLPEGNISTRVDVTPGSPDIVVGDLDGAFTDADKETASCIYTQKGNKKIRKPQAANQTALIFDRRAAARLLSINSIRRLCWS